MTRRERIIWSAGFIDGEGCILIWGKRYQALRLSVAQDRLEPLLILEELFGGRITPWENRGRRYHVWIIASAAAGKAIRELEPFLVRKRSEARFALEFQSRRNPVGCNRKSDEQRAWDVWAKSELSRMKQVA